MINQTQKIVVIFIELFFDVLEDHSDDDDDARFVLELQRSSINPFNVKIDVKTCKAASSSSSVFSTFAWLEISSVVVCCDADLKTSFYLD